jgi:hypothetical protein
MLLVGLKKTQATEEAIIDDAGGDTGGSSWSSELTDAQYIEKIMKDNDIQPKVLIVKQDEFGRKFDPAATIRCRGNC